MRLNKLVLSGDHRTLVLQMKKLESALPENSVLDHLRGLDPSYHTGRSDMYLGPKTV